MQELGEWMHDFLQILKTKEKKGLLCLANRLKTKEECEMAWLSACLNLRGSKHESRYNLTFQSENQNAKENRKDIPYFSSEYKCFLPDTGRNRYDWV